MTFSTLNKHKWRLALVAALIVVGCGQNPVTGKRELHLVSEAQEVQIGQEQYSPSQQMQGGSYTVDPELSRYVNGVGQRLAKVSDRPELPFEFVVLNNGVPNAWALPGGKIAVNRGLLTELDSEAELAAVLGHEIVHATARHGAKSMERGILMQAGVAVLGATMADRNWAGLVVGGASLGASLISTKYGRDAELESDQYGIKYMVKAGYDPQAAVSLQQTFMRLSEGRRSNWLEGMFASHPPSQERVEANRHTAAQYRTANLRIGREEYQQRIAVLEKSAQAYAKYDQGQQALKDKQFDKAIGLADEAIRKEPREAMFYALRGDARVQLKDARTAVQDYSEAIRRKGDYFEFYLERGIARRQFNDNAAARADLEQSLKLLPTAVAHLELGNLAAAEKNETKAIEHYAAAAGSDSDIGKQAAVSLMKLDLPKNPAKYVEVQTGLSRNGEFVIQLSNKAPLAVKGMVLSISGGLTRQMTVAETLPVGKVRQLVLTVPANISPQSIKVQLTAAKLAE